MVGITVGTFYIVSYWVRLYIAESGIWHRDKWGRRSHLDWSDVGEVVRVRILIFSYFRLASRSTNTVLWIPLPLQNQAEFERLLTQWAPDVAAYLHGPDQSSYHPD